jgi:hypothetical protein
MRVNMNRFNRKPLSTSLSQDVYDAIINADIENG